MTSNQHEELLTDGSDPGHTGSVPGATGSLGSNTDAY